MYFDFYSVYFKVIYSDNLFIFILDTVVGDLEIIKSLPS